MDKRNICITLETETGNDIIKGHVKPIDFFLLEASVIAVDVCMDVNLD